MLGVTASAAVLVPCIILRISKLQETHALVLVSREVRGRCARPLVLHEAGLQRAWALLDVSIDGYDFSLHTYTRCRLHMIMPPTQPCGLDLGRQV